MQVMNEYQLLLGWWNFTFHWHFSFFQTPWAHWPVNYNHKTPTPGTQQAVNKHSCLSHRLITLLTCEHAPQPAHKYRRSDWSLNSVSPIACSRALGIQQMLPERPKWIAKGWLCLWDRVTRAPGTSIAQPPVESIPSRHTAKSNQSSEGDSSPRWPEAISPDSATPTSSLRSARPGGGHIPSGDLWCLCWDGGNAAAVTVPSGDACSRLSCWRDAGWPQSRAQAPPGRACCRADHSNSSCLKTCPQEGPCTEAGEPKPQVLREIQGWDHFFGFLFFSFSPSLKEWWETSNLQDPGRSTHCGLNNQNNVWKLDLAHETNSLFPAKYFFLSFCFRHHFLCQKESSVLRPRWSSPATVWPWANHFCPLDLSFLVSQKKGTSQIRVHKVKWLSGSSLHLYLYLYLYLCLYCCLVA